MITPHFPPDSTAGTHRVRLLAPYLPEHGWDPTVLTVDPAYYEGLPDQDLERLVPGNLRVERIRALPVRLFRLAGIGDLGLRSLAGLYSASARLLSRERYDAVYITIYPSYTALLGPRLKRRFRIPFVLDYQDPWVGAWGDTVGMGPDGTADWKSRMSRKVATILEPRVLRHVDAMTAVSSETMDAVLRRNPQARDVPTATIPIGGDPRDFEMLRTHPRTNTFFDPGDGNFHICYVGTLLPLGFDTLRAFLDAVAAVRDSRPDLYDRLRLHFIGTSNSRTEGSPPRVIEHARQAGVADRISEHATRVDYLDALAIQTQASALLLMGSTEPHYTASKLYPAMLAGRPILGIYHRDSSVSEILRKNPEPHLLLVQFDAHDPPQNQVDSIASVLVGLMESASPSTATLPPGMDEAFSARSLAGILARLLDSVSGGAEAALRSPARV